VHGATSSSKTQHLFFDVERSEQSKGTVKDKLRKLLVPKKDEERKIEENHMMSSCIIFILRVIMLGG
jgi:hypothetical protein